MALIDNTITWNGERSEAWYAGVVMSPGSIEKGAVMTLNNIKGKRQVPRIQVPDLWMADSCTWAPTGNVTISDREIAPTKMKLMTELCSTDFDDTFLAMTQSPGANDVELPDSFEDFLFEEIGKKSAAEIERQMWQGDTGLAAANFLARYDGYHKLMTADGNIVKVSAPTVITELNIIDELAKLHAIVPDVITSSSLNDSLRLYMNQSMHRMYIRALAGNSPIAYWDTQGRSDNGFFLDLPIIICPGMLKGKFIVTYPMNMWFGTDVLEDHQDIKIISLENTLGEEMYRIKGRMAAGVQYGISEEIFLYDGS